MCFRILALESPVFSGISSLSLVVLTRPSALARGRNALPDCLAPSPSVPLLATHLLRKHIYQPTRPTHQQVVPHLCLPTSALAQLSLASKAIADGHSAAHDRRLRALSTRRHVGDVRARLNGQHYLQPIYVGLRLKMHCGEAPLPECRSPVGVVTGSAAARRRLPYPSGRNSRRT